MKYFKMLFLKDRILKASLSFYGAAASLKKQEKDKETIMSSLRSLDGKEARNLSSV